MTKMVLKPTTYLYGYSASSSLYCYYNNMFHGEMYITKLSAQPPPTLVMTISSIFRKRLILAILEG